MKTIYSLLFALTFSATSIAQECVDFSNVIGSSLADQEVYNQDGIKLTASNYISHDAHSLDFSGLLEVDLEPSSCNDRKLSIEGSWISEFYVDGQLIPLVGVMDSYGVFNAKAETGDSLIVIGDFEKVKIVGSTSRVYSICLTDLCPAVSTKKLTVNTFEIYPNPASDYIRINTNYEKVEIVNYTGAIVYSSNVKLQNIDVTNLASGTYFIKALNGNATSVSRFIKK